MERRAASSGREYGVVFNPLSSALSADPYTTYAGCARGTRSTAAGH